MIRFFSGFIAAFALTMVLYPKAQAPPYPSLKPYALVIQDSCYVNKQEIASAGDVGRFLIREIVE